MHKLIGQLIKNKNY